MFFVDDFANQPLADAYGVVAGTSHIGKYSELIHNMLLWEANVRYRANAEGFDRVE